MTATHPIRFGVFTGVAQTTWPDLLEVWQRVDEMGFDTGWVPDHFYAGYGDPAGPCFEAGTVLAAVAARTRRIGVGPLVLSNTFRHPAVLANMAASLDHVAGGASPSASARDGSRPSTTAMPCRSARCGTASSGSTRRSR